MAAGGMGRQQINGDMGHEGGLDGGSGGPGQVQHVLSDDMLYKLSKKIAQLTKVIYSLNTKNDDLEFDMDALRSTYDEKLEKVSKSTNPPMRRRTGIFTTGCLTYLSLPDRRI